MLGVAADYTIGLLIVLMHLVRVSIGSGKYGTLPRPE
jgi:hypothetical protein